MLWPVVTTNGAAEACFLVFSDVDAGREGLIRQALPVVVDGLVEALAADQEL
ncbi:hypothetical protein [Microbacterium aurugineum]|uniref:hypothetical protein n=1 Tax=Microbacterium aurugineum TaxID=2851642 RepID=UPI0020BEFF70|nr:hypothetical protein [Microbacterium aurugineum]MCK8475809.1 hypothetical protein [Microbacterium aurugineum]